MGLLAGWATSKTSCCQKGRDVGAGAVRRPRSFGRGTLREKRLCCGPADGETPHPTAHDAAPGPPAPRCRSSYGPSLLPISTYG